MLFPSAWLLGLPFLSSLFRHLCLWVRRESDYKRLWDWLPIAAGSLLLAPQYLLVEKESEACEEGGCLLAISGGPPVMRLCYQRVSCLFQGGLSWEAFSCQVGDWGFCVWAAFLFWVGGMQDASPLCCSSGSGLSNQLASFLPHFAPLGASCTIFRTILVPSRKVSGEWVYTILSELIIFFKIYFREQGEGQKERNLKQTPC